jgi:serine/threonine protein phosphatase PrpC
MKFEIAHYSMRGMRPSNEDRIAVVERDNAVLMIVADGLGGHRGGEIAAELLVQTMTHAFQSIRTRILDKPSAFLALSIMQAHHAIVRRGKASLSAIQPRTTCVACVVQNGYAYWAHVGDSRLYHFRHGRLKERTQDHSTVEELRKDGLVSEDEMRAHPQKGRLLNCVGGPNKPTIELGEEVALSRDDVLLLCSDGLWEAHTPEELIRFLSHKGSLEEGLEESLFSAEKRMGDRCDNISAVTMRWEEDAPLSLPLQGNKRTNVDEREMVRAAANMRGAMKKQENNRTTAAPEESTRSIADEIQELEKFLRNREPKI